MNSVFLVEDLSSAEANIIVEQKLDESGSKKNWWLQGTFMAAEIKNRNGRIYPLKEMENAVRSLNEQIQQYNGVFGELDHPQTLTINADRISHVIVEVAIVGTNAVGKMRLLDTPMGKIGQELVSSGVRVGVSSRGTGIVGESGQVAQFGVVTVDMVITPSAPGAMPSAVYESLNRARNGKSILTLAEAVVEDDKAQKYFQKEMNKFLDNLIN